MKGQSHASIPDKDIRTMPGLANVERMVNGGDNEAKGSEATPNACTNLVLR